ncbi:1-(5-phosphoribosyl)-5-[(5-phosphoribosylamino)methylideneamino]imidazole-4-carboxamide isomerase [Sedimentibacter saalensis]|uniref:1-(5-phosphoribosyl)-5-[(5-phosphoribosylamino)methylideneamino] imidazole-4-carboxamide isomerase n=1 Tax=Sedimentibacter saalensis TaxID=130788 RepID=A0A562JLW0_9FIRM|nr:1-(5-phosphoribosyl)-5-[(5-phosphoribosylamino)methylideneamino]imidazole-4-carboxamide isomerase [Sedimentibacter saalensis]MEA5096078.1 1-(5-phosphoribosyl)-5-[(5-phosphoribosylamino)methylideneamino]imidazole-4-carboxamide isomerase [Sedimentibacter saalensis]TWH83975.1 1-(5-phosphoribosyl)-5-[(5-phosphoribosylamino)methylideneamino] imidazole-4-carboxamide isomerase [Sedimentibacter saalensis]
MILFPAIDIKDNKCVRLTQGKFELMNVYSDDPVDMAKKWESLGAEYLHVVDLDGAKDEGFNNRKSIEKIAKSIKIPMQTGGGIRNSERIKNLIDIGVERAIVGTMAIENQELLTELASIYKEHLAVSIDAFKGKVATRGWQDVGNVDSIEICKFLESIGISTLVYTDISKDGMLSGPNFEIYEELSRKTKLNIIASGGVTSIDDIKRLDSMNMYGAIIGKALYDNKLDFNEALKAIKN